jgi:hypothetical protein
MSDLLSCCCSPAPNTKVPLGITPRRGVTLNVAPISFFGLGATPTTSKGARARKSKSPRRSRAMADPQAVEKSKDMWPWPPQRNTPHLTGNNDFFHLFSKPAYLTSTDTQSSARNLCSHQDAMMHKRKAFSV